MRSGIACQRNTPAVRARGCRPPVSRILSTPPKRSWTAISLTPPKRSAPLARDATNTRGSNGRAALPLLCLAPRGVCRAAPVTRKRGGLLPHPFTLTCALAGHRRFTLCCTVRPNALRRLSPTFVRRVALWCPDFPQPPLARKLRPSGERRLHTAPSRIPFQGKVCRIGHSEIHRYPRRIFLRTRVAPMRLTPAVGPL